MRQDILSENHIREIGRLVVNVSKLDTLLTDLISIFSETHIFFAVLMIHHQQFSSKTDTLLSIMKFLFQGMDEKDLDKLLSPIFKSKAVADYRNTIVHSIWVIDGDGAISAVKFQARGTFKRTRTPASAKDIGAQADIAFHLAKDLVALRDHFHGNVPPHKNDEEV